MKRFKWVIWLVLGSLLGVGLILASQRWSRQNVAELTRWRQSKLSPVIMIPGSSATENRFDRLVRKLNTDNRNPHSLLKVRVTNDDRLHFSGQLRQGDNEPIIVVGFENNRDGYQNIQPVRCCWMAMPIPASAPCAVIKTASARSMNWVCLP